MDLKSGYPWWAVKNGLMHAFPPLERDLRCDVAVVGGGITGALIADEFARHGHEVAVLEQRDIALRTSARTTRFIAGPDGQVAGLQFAEGPEEPADLVILTVGVRPRD